MAILGYTSGELPIIFYSKQKIKKNKNKRYSCKCGHKTTKNQLKINGGICHQCYSRIV